VPPRRAYLLVRFKGYTAPGGRGQGNIAHEAGVPEQKATDTWNIDQALLDRLGNQEVQLALFYSYGSNPPQYPKWHDYFRKHQPPTLIVWGKNDPIFPPAGAEPYKKDLGVLFLGIREPPPVLSRAARVGRDGGAHPGGRGSGRWRRRGAVPTTCGSGSAAGQSSCAASRALHSAPRAFP
jgi:hypothetical protein